MKRFFFILAVLLTTQFGLNSLTLSEKLSQSSKGDYVVTLMNKTYSLISVYDKGDDSLIFEHISVPYSAVKRAPDWKKYVQNGAPKASSWLLYELDLKTGTILECYSVLNQSHQDLSSFDSLLSKLMALDLTNIAAKDRRRIGIESSLSGFDTRKIWNPPQMFNRKKEKKPQYDVFHANWPEDGTILADKTVEIYFDAKRGHFPFPFWMQVKDDSNASFKLPSVDAGQGLISTISSMPRRLPYFYEKVRTHKDKIVVKTNLPRYYKGLRLHFVTYNPIPSDPIYVDAVQVDVEGEECTEFHISKKQINQLLENNVPYHFGLTSTSHRHMNVESAKSVKFKKSAT